MAAPGSVTNVMLSPHATRMERAWAARAAATAYRVEYREAAKANWASAGTPPAPRRAVPRLKAAAYAFRVRAQDADGAGDGSADQPAVTLAAGSPDRSQNVVGAPGEGTLQAAWDAVAGATGYDSQINVRPPWQAAVRLAAAVRSYTFTDLAYRQRYALRLRAAKGALRSSYACANGTTTRPAPEIRNVAFDPGPDSRAVARARAPAGAGCQIQVRDAHDAQVGGTRDRRRARPSPCPTWPCLRRTRCAFAARTPAAGAHGWSPR